MPDWFVVLAKVLAMLARLVPMVEEQFGAQPGQGPEKRAQVLARVADYVERGPDGSLAAGLTPAQQRRLMMVAEGAVDEIVSAANDAGIFRRSVGAPTEPESGGAGRSGGRRGSR